MTLITLCIQYNLFSNCQSTFSWSIPLSSKNVSHLRIVKMFTVDEIPTVTNACTIALFISKIFLLINTVKPLNSGHLRVLKSLTVIKRFPLLGGNFKKIFTCGTKRFVCYSWHVRCLGCPLLGGFILRLYLKVH